MTFNENVESSGTARIAGTSGIGSNWSTAPEKGIFLVRAILLTLFGRGGRGGGGL